MFTLDQKLCPDPDVVDTELDSDELVLLHLGSKTYYSLNGSGMKVWHALKRGLSLGEISRSMQEEFEVDSKTADQGVLRIASELAEEKLLRVRE